MPLTDYMKNDYRKTIIGKHIVINFHNLHLNAVIKITRDELSHVELKISKQW